VTGRGVTLFYSYSHADEELRVQLAKHLKMLERQGIIQGWSDRDISAGSEWRSQIDQHLERADIVLLLISPDFISSDYCYDIELAQALRRHNAGECVVVPIFFREVDSSGSPFAELQGLPKDARPVTSWPNRDEAFSDIASGLRKIALSLVDSQTISPKQGVLGSNGNSAQTRDIERIAKYRHLFDRPAFTSPCIFEFSLESVSATCDQITSAMLTGKVSIKAYLYDLPVDRELPARDSFETDLFLSTLSQVGNYISNVKGTVTYLRAHLSQPDAGSPANMPPNADDINHMEFFLAALIRDGVASQRFVRKAFAVMDKIDSERNAIIELMNSLWRLANVRELPYITLSSQQLELSKDMRQYDWDHFFVRSHDFLRRFLESGERDGEIL
jgi:hypothetical protein